MEPDSPPGDLQFRLRLQEVVDMHRSVAALARSTGCSDSAIRKWLAGASEPTRENLVKLAIGGGVSLAWLAAGQGPKWLDQEQTYGLSKEFVLIPRYDIEASAGAGSFLDREHATDYAAFRHEWVRSTLGVDPRSLVLITAVGDSMEPAIRSGDLLLVDRAVRNMHDDAIYVILSNDLLVVKRLQRFSTGVVAIKSDNPAYAEETLPATEAERLRIAGRVRWISRLI